MAEVCDANPHRVLDNHDFSKADQRAIDADVDVLPGRARHAQHRAHFKMQQISQGHDPAVQLNLQIDAGILEVFDLLVERHTSCGYGLIAPGSGVVTGGVERPDRVDGSVEVEPVDVEPAGAEPPTAASIPLRSWCEPICCSKSANCANWVTKVVPSAGCDGS